MHPSWWPYPDTLLLFPEADLIVDLRRPISPQSTHALARLGLGRSFGVVTACNPYGRSLEESSNLRLSRVLSEIVRLRLPAARRADGSSPDGGHLEPGWALPEPLEEVRELAARFFQNGIFWFEHDRFFIVPVLATGPTLALPVGSAAV